MSDETSTLRLKMLLDGQAVVDAQLRQLADSVGSFGEKISGVALAFAAFAGLKGFEEKAAEVIELGRSLTILKNSLGASIPDLLATRKLLVENGESADMVGTMYGHMQKAIITAMDTGGTAEKVFRDLKLNLDDIAKEDAGTQFRQIGEALAGIENPAKRTALAVELFGKAGYSMRGVFSNLKEIQETVEKESDFSNAMNRSTAAKAS